ncbi:MAG TPA: hypothetical protein VLJ59_13595 [Mycobacteriales bacterium]|nr:hypothetical protein [Mycobacteriales bacterium]
MADASFDQILSGSLVQDITTELTGLDKVHVTVDGGTTTTLAGTVGSTVTVTLEPVTTTSTVDLKPVTTTSTVDLKPVTTTSTVDLKPVVVDSCVRLELGPLPPTEISTPYEQRWAMSLWGLEIFALSVSGRTTTEVRPADRRPIVVG